MMKITYFKNLFGQIRVYSLVDLILFAIAIGSDKFQIASIILLHLGFLLFLESRHKHNFRVPLPKYLWAVLIIAGTFFYQNIAVLGFLLASFLYVKKNSAKFGAYAPVARGLQGYFLAAGVAGFLNPLSFLAGALGAIRNFAGDLRDIVKDRGEGLKTLPIIFGLKKDFKQLHLLALFATTLVWWYLSGISGLWLVPVFLIQIGSYNLTPR